jgi:hypothetical protein
MQVRFVQSSSGQRLSKINRIKRCNQLIWLRFKAMNLQISYQAEAMERQVDSNQRILKQKSIKYLINNKAINLIKISVLKR